MFYGESTLATSKGGPVPYEGQKKMKYSLIFCLLSLTGLLFGCNSNTKKFEGEWLSDNLQTKLNISKISDKTFLIVRKLDSLPKWNRKTTGFYNEDTGTVSFKVEEENFPYNGMVEKSYNISYDYDKNKIFVDDSGNLGWMSKVAK